jgi:MoxR-like ATPase
MLAGKVRALIEGRFHVSYADIKAAAAMCLRHRVLLNFEAEADRVDVDGLVKQIIDLTPTDPVKVGA